jgi:hypothetical protein
MEAKAQRMISSSLVFWKWLSTDGTKDMNPGIQFSTQIKVAKG